MHENHVAHRYVVITLAFPSLIWPTLGTVRMGTSCLTRQICFPSLSTPPRLIEVRTSVERPSGTREHDVRRDICSLILVCHVDMTLPILDTPIRGGDKSAPEHQDRATQYNPYPTDVYYLGNLVREFYIQVCAFCFFSRHIMLTKKSRNAKGLSLWSR